MGSSSLPPGFRFHPTDEELVDYYLKRKVDGLQFDLEVIPVIELYKFDPWELPDKSFLPKRDMEWFFFCPRDRKYPNGSRTNRATRAGYWKATGKDRTIVCQSGVTGYRKTLVFYRGRAPLGDRTDWVMHEYRLTDDIPQGSSGSQGAFALCRVVKKNEHIPKMGGDLQGESKSKTVGSSSSAGNFASSGFSSEVLSTSNENPSQATDIYNGSSYSSPVSSPYGIGEFHPTSIDTCQTNVCQTNVWVSPDQILDTSKVYSQGQDLVSEYLKGCEYSNMAPSYTNFIEEVNPITDDFIQNSFMSPYPEQINYAGHYGNEYTAYPSFGQSDSINGLETWNPATLLPMICRQTSGDGSLVELTSLWLQEDNMVI